MIKHIVLFRFKEKEKELPIAKEKLEKIFAQAEGCLYYDLAENITPCPTGYDLVINCAFETKEKLEAYAKCEAHQAFVAYIGGVTSGIAEADYEE